MATNNDYLNDMAGEARNSGKTNNELLEEIASNGSSAGLTNEERALLETIPNKADLVMGKVPESQLPSYVDSVQEYPARSEFPETGETNVIYVNAEDNTTFRWGGSMYVQITSGLVLGETSSSAHRGDHGVIAYQHTLLHNNPHSVTKGQIGLGNVDNTSDAEKPVSAPAAAALFMKENLITPSTTDHYYRGDKSWAMLNKGAVGLGNVDNTADTAKPISDAQRAVNNAKADLVNGRVPTSQLPSYIDSVQEYAAIANFPTTGQMNVVYLAVDTNKPYRWGGSSYVEISSGVALGETSASAYRGDRGKIAFDHTSLTNNPHAVTKSQVGLGNADNTSDTNKPVSNATQSALNAKQNTLVSGTNIKTVNGVSVLGSGNININQVIERTTANNITKVEYADRFEYIGKYTFSLTIPTGAGRYVTVNTGMTIPDGLRINAADEHYISISNSERGVTTTAWDNGSGQIFLGFYNSWSANNPTAGSLFVKLVRYK